MKTRNHLVQLRSLFEENELDVLAVSESWLNSSVKNAEVEIQGYKFPDWWRCMYIQTCFLQNEGVKRPASTTHGNICSC